MSKTYIPAGYQSVLTLYETQNAIGLIHQTFEEHLSQTLNLKRVSAPLFHRTERQPQRRRTSRKL